MKYQVGDVVRLRCARTEYAGYKGHKIIAIVDNKYKVSFFGTGEESSFYWEDSEIAELLIPAKVINSKLYKLLNEENHE